MMGQLFRFGGIADAPLAGNAMTADDHAYYRRRIQQEEEAARLATSREARRLHREMAKRYRSLSA